MPDPISKKAALKILTASCSPSVVEHCKAVSREAKKIAEKIKANGHDVDVDFVETAALLHDIGRSVTHDIMHGVEGARILREHPEYARVCCCHLGGGIDREEAETLGLPTGDYLPKTLEEKIICYADKLVEGAGKITLPESIKKFSDRLGPDHPTIKRIKELDEELRGLMG
jgi:uncharacterized protein